MELLHLVADPDRAVPQFDFAHGVKRTNAASPDLQVTAGFGFVRVPLLPGHNRLVGLFLTGLQQRRPSVAVTMKSK
jgi:hypothetical protein